MTWRVPVKPSRTTNETSVPTVADDSYFNKMFPGIAERNANFKNLVFVRWKIASGGCAL